MGWVSCPPYGCFWVNKPDFFVSRKGAKAQNPYENPSIGIVLCKLKNKTIVEYVLRESNKPIGVATYQIVSTVPQELKYQLPAPEQVAKLL